MNITYPHTIDNGHGERLTFVELVKEPDGDKLIVEGVCQPNAGPPMHVHFKQDEGFTVTKGKIAYQTLGGEEKVLEEGQSVLFKKGEAHRFWNAGEGEAVLKGYVKPVNTLPFFLSAMYDAQKRGKNGRPDDFDAAYLMTRYKSEYDMLALPGFVKKVIIPITYQIGKLTGKYKKFREAPSPIK